MYPGLHAGTHPDQPCIVIAGSGRTITYGRFDRRANRLAHALRAAGLRPRDHFAIFMENSIECIEACSAGARTGLYYTCINSHLTATELAYILDNSESRVVVTSRRHLQTLLDALPSAPSIERCFVVDGTGAPTSLRGASITRTNWPDALSKSGPEGLRPYPSIERAPTRCPTRSLRRLGSPFEAAERTRTDTHLPTNGHIDEPRTFCPRSTEARGRMAAPARARRGLARERLLHDARR